MKPSHLIAFTIGVSMGLECWAIETNRHSTILFAFAAALASAIVLHFMIEVESKDSRRDTMESVRTALTQYNILLKKEFKNIPTIVVEESALEDLN